MSMMIQSGRFGGGTPTPTPTPTPTDPHRYWRAVAFRSNGDYISGSELEMAETAGGANTIGSGTPMGTPEYPYSATFARNNMFDLNNATLFASVKHHNAWLGYDFGAGNEKAITEVRWRSRTDGDPQQFPSFGKVEYSDDGIQWFTSWYFRNAAAPAINTLKVFTRPATALDTARYWVLLIEATQSTEAPGFNELQLRTASGGASVASGGTVIYSGQYDAGTWKATNAFDGNTATGWSSDAGPRVNLVGEYIGYDFGASNDKTIIEVAISSRTDTAAGAQCGPTRAHVLSSADGVNFIRQWGFDVAPTWVMNETRVFPKADDMPWAARYFHYSGREEAFVVPAGITQMRIRMWGGGAGGGWYAGGRYGCGGGFGDITVPVVAGDLVALHVAQGGCSHGFGPSGGWGGWPDGGTGAYGDTGGGGGGGSSRVFVNGTLKAVVGGGGAAAGYQGWGGQGGGPNANGGDSGVGLGRPGTTSGPGHAGGTIGLSSWQGTAQDACGEGGGYWENAKFAPLTFANRFCQRGGHGGPQGGATNGDGGGGGGGYYGGAGGGGDGQAGGGGSGYAAVGVTVTTALGGLHNDQVAKTDPVFPPGSPISMGTPSNTGVWGGNGLIHVTLS